MRVFVGYWYDPRDGWIESQIVPLLEAMHFTILDGKELYGEGDITDAVRRRIEQADIAVGFLTLRHGAHDPAASHPWVLAELAHANGNHKPVLIVLEDGGRIDNPLLQGEQRIPLKQDDRLKCAVELLEAVRRWTARRLQIVPVDEQLDRKIWRMLRSDEFRFEYRTRRGGVDSAFQETRLERVNPGGLYCHAIGLPDDALIEVRGSFQGAGVFSSGWASVDAVQIKVA